MSNVYLVLIIAIALLLRVYDLANNPIALNQDEAINGYDAYSLITTMGDHHGNFMPIMLESFGDWVSPVITYITIPFVQLLGLSEFSIRLPVALLGVGTVVLIYLFSLQVFNDKKLALIAAFFLAIMPWHITLSRWAIPPSIVPFFLLLFMTV
ncbi:MAG: phospholipid carrier-dependent glycosyltransferase, partial [Dolichospermum sp.]